MTTSSSTTATTTTLAHNQGNLGAMIALQGAVNAPAPKPAETKLTGWAAIAAAVVFASQQELAKAEAKAKAENTAVEAAIAAGQAAEAAEAIGAQANRKVARRAAQAAIEAAKVANSAGNRAKMAGVKAAVYRAAFSAAHRAVRAARAALVVADRPVSEAEAKARATKAAIAAEVDEEGRRTAASLFGEDRAIELVAEGGLALLDHEEAAARKGRTFRRRAA